MATLIRCDRCLAEGIQVVPVLGKDLCNRCIGDFASWVNAGLAEASAHRRMRNGDWARAIRLLLERDGHVTPDTLAAETATPRAKAHWALRWEKGQGRLFQEGKSRFVAPLEAAE